MRISRFADVAVASDVPFTDLPAVSAPPDIVIRPALLDTSRAAPIQEWADDAGRPWLTIARAGDGYLVTLPDLDCRISGDGRAVTFDARPPLADAALTHLLLHQVLPLALSRIGRLVLHACAVETPHGTIAFLGRSGAGKSTLAAAFCRRGFALVADDALAVDLDRDDIGVWPTADGVRLWHDMRAAAPAAGAIEITGSGKLRAPVRLAQSRSRLTRLLLLGTSDDATATIAPVPASGARIEMLSHLFRLDITDRAESARLFEAAHRVASAVPARSIIYPDGIEFLDAAVDAVLRDFA